MASGFGLGLFLVFVMMLYQGATAQSGCMSTLMTLSPCLNYVTGNSSTPSSACCSLLASVVQNKPECLCTLVNGGGSSLGISINQTRALGLPGTCGVQTPPVSRCNGGSGPATLPVSSPESPPADSSDDTPSTTGTSIPQGSGSKTVPTSVDTSDAKNMGTQLHLTSFLIFIASCSSNAVRF